MPTGKRNQSRLRTRLRARLVSRLGEERCILLNLSQQGACANVSEDFIAQDVILKWEQFEAFGQIVWRDGGRVGIRFDQTLPYEWVLATREADANTAPICDVVDARQAAKAWSEGQRFV